MRHFIAALLRARRILLAVRRVLSTHFCVEDSPSLRRVFAFASFLRRSRVRRRLIWISSQAAGRSASSIAARSRRSCSFCILLTAFPCLKNEMQPELHHPRRSTAAHRRALAVLLRRVAPEVPRPQARPARRADRLCQVTPAVPALARQTWLPSGPVCPVVLRGRAYQETPAWPRGPSAPGRPGRPCGVLEVRAVLSSRRRPLSDPS